MRKSRSSAIVAAAVAGIVAYAQPAEAASITWVGGVTDPMSATYTTSAEITTFTGLTSGMPLQLWDSSSMNWLAGGTSVAYSVGDDLTFTDNLIGGQVILVDQGNLNPQSMQFVDAGAGFTEYWFLRGDEFQESPGDFVGSSSPFGSGLAGFTMVLDTGFDGIVRFRDRANSTSRSDSVIVRSGILAINDSLALPGSTGENQNRTNVELAGGQFNININTSDNNEPASSNLGGHLLVSADSVMHLGRLSMDNPGEPGSGTGDSRSWQGSITINSDVTLTVNRVDPGVVMRLQGNLSTSSGTLLLANNGTVNMHVRLEGNAASNGDNVIFDLGSGTNVLETNNTADLGALFGGANTVLQGNGTFRIGGRDENVTYGGLIQGGLSVGKVGTATLTLTSNNTYTGTTSVSGGTLDLTGTNSTGTVSVTGGTLLLSGANGGVGSANVVGISGGGALRVDNATNNNARLSDTAVVTLNRGVLEFVGNQTVGTAEQAQQLIIAGNANTVRTLASGAGTPASLTFTDATAGFVRNGGFVNFEIAPNTNINFTAPPALNDGLIGAYATVNNSDWATISGNSVAALGAYTTAGNGSNPNTWVATDNVDVTATTGLSLTTSATINSLKFSGAGAAVNISAGAGLTIDTGGILAAGTSGGTLGGPGTLTTGTGAAPTELTVIVPDAANTLTIGASIVDNGANGTVMLVKTGEGKLVLSGSGSTFSGGLSIQGGTLAAGGANVFPATGALVVDFGTTFDIGGFNQSFGTVSLINGSIVNSGGAASLNSASGYDVRNGTISASLGGTGTLTKTTGATVTLDAVNTYSGLTTVQDGTLIPAVAGAIPVGGAVTVAGGELNIGNISHSLGTVTISDGEISGGSGVITGTVYEIQGGTVSTVLAGSAPLNKSGDGGSTGTLSALNTYTGVTTLQSGSLSINSLVNGGLPSSIGQSGSAASNLVFQGGTLNYVGPSTSTDRLFHMNGDGAIFSNGSGSLTFSNFGTITGGGIITLGGGGGSGTNTFNPAISGGVGLQKNSGGTWVLGQSNTFSNELRVTNGTLDIQSFNQNTGNFLLTGGNLVGSGILTPSNTDLQAGTAAVVIAGNINLNKNTAGTATLTAANTLTGEINVNQGTLAVSQIADGGLPSGLGQSSAAATSLKLGGNATLSYVGSGGSTDRLFTLNGDSGLASSGTGPVNWTNTGSLANSGVEFRLAGNNTGANTFAPLIHGATRVFKANGGQWVLTNNNTYTNTTTIEGGTLTIGAIANGGVASPIGASTSDAGNLILSGGALRYTGAGATTDRLFTVGRTNAGSAALSGTIDSSGTGALVFSNPGAINSGAGTGVRTLNLTGDNTGDNRIAGVLSDANTGAGSLLNVAKAGTGKWILSGANTYTGTTIVNGGTLQLNLAAHGPVLPGTATTSFADVQAGSLVFDYTGGGTVGPTVLGILDAGFDQPDRFSAGQIRSTTVTSTIGLGWEDDSATQQVTVKRTFYGDADLNGQVDVADLGILASNWQVAGNWSTADFDYSGFIDVADLGLLASNWQAGVGSPLGPSLQAALAAVGLSNVSVPEPAAVTVAGLALTGLGLRRRRSLRA
jgi:fibronectin-binding autotransporter adhesin